MTHQLAHHRIEDKTAIPSRPVSVGRKLVTCRFLDKLL